VPPPKITLFYSPLPKVSRGETSKVCYGTESVAAVRLDPPVAEVYPAYSRCVEFVPDKTSEYRLIARGRSGTEISATTYIEVAGPRPKFSDLQISATSVAPGEQVQFCFQAVNGVSVKGAPGKFLRGGNAAADCLIDMPQRTTTYRLTVTGAGGQSDSDEITVQVKGQK
jgi:hypothetical protein